MVLRYSTGLREPREILILASQYQRMGASKNLAVERRAGHDVGRVT